MYIKSAMKRITHIENEDFIALCGLKFRDEIHTLRIPESNNIPMELCKRCEKKLNTQ